MAVKAESTHLGIALLSIHFQLQWFGQTVSWPGPATVHDGAIFTLLPSLCGWHHSPGPCQWCVDPFSKPGQLWDGWRLCGSCGALKPCSPCAIYDKAYNWTLPVESLVCFPWTRLGSKQLKKTQEEKIENRWKTYKTCEEKHLKKMALDLEPLSWDPRRLKKAGPTGGGVLVTQLLRWNGRGHIYLVYRLIWIVCFTTCIPCMIVRLYSIWNTHRIRWRHHFMQQLMIHYERGLFFMMLPQNIRNALKF